MNPLAFAAETIVFVSHSMALVKDFCTRAIWLDNGLLRMDDVPEKVAEVYLKERG